MYEWRNMSLADQQRMLGMRKYHNLPWHTPPHWDRNGEEQFLVSAACYEHAPTVGKNPQRMAECEQQVLDVCQALPTMVWAWCILPNHYHILVQTPQVKGLLAELGKFHGRSSHGWNGEDGCRGRQTWHSCFDRTMRSEGHFYASMNYVHHNPVKHGYAARWQEWPYSSAVAYIEQVRRKKAEEIWLKYPILDYGKDWGV